jgi:hypothetical protein
MKINEDKEISPEKKFVKNFSRFYKETGLNRLN